MKRLIAALTAAAFMLTGVVPVGMLTYANADFVAPPQN